MSDNDGEATKTTTRQRMSYKDFNLRFSTYSEADSVGTFKVWVEGQVPGGAMRPDDAVARTYDPKAFWDEPTTRKLGLVGKLEKRIRLTTEDLFKLGDLLADLALPQEGGVRRLFEMSLAALGPDEGLRLRLHIDPVALAELPWEYMAISQASGERRANDFLALRREISIVRTDTVEAIPRALPQRPVARVVGVLSSPDDQDTIEVGKDRQAVNEAVEDVNSRVGEEVLEAEWVAIPATIQAVSETLSTPADIFHFAGHGVFDPLSKEGKVILETENHASSYYKGEQLASLLRNAGVRLAVLGACDSGRRDGQNSWSGIAPGLTREQVPAVIGNQFRIETDNAALIAKTLYPMVLGGYTIDEALFLARHAVYAKAGLEQRDWGVPVLYMQDADGILFPKAEGASQGAAGDPSIKVWIKLNEIAGEVVGLRAEEFNEGDANVRIEGGDVKEGGSVVGADLGIIGQPRSQKSN